MDISIITDDPDIGPIVQDLYQLSQQNDQLPRWAVGICYRTPHGFSSTAFYLEELWDLHDIVERGPDFSTIEKIVIKYALLS